MKRGGSSQLSSVSEGFSRSGSGKGDFVPIGVLSHTLRQSIRNIFPEFGGGRDEAEDHVYMYICVEEQWLAILRVYATLTHSHSRACIDMLIPHTCSSVSKSYLTDTSISQARVGPALSREVQETSYCSLDLCIRALCSLFNTPPSKGMHVYVAGKELNGGMYQGVIAKHSGTRQDIMLFLLAILSNVADSSKQMREYIIKWDNGTSRNTKLKSPMGDLINKSSCGGGEEFKSTMIDSLLQMLIFETKPCIPDLLATDQLPSRLLPNCTPYDTPSKTKQCTIR